MNLADIKAQVNASIKALSPSVSYDRATKIAFTAGTIITRVFSASWAIAVWTAKSLHLIALVAIGLVLMAVELWQDRRRVKAAISDQYLMLCLMGSMFIRLNVIMPAKEFKVRSRVAFKTMTVGLDY